VTTPKILIVEDESIVALDMETRLVHLGYQVVGTADTGEQALKIAETSRPDLALMDIRLKGSMDGIQTAELLRARFDIPVVYLTAYADDATLQRAKQTLPHGYLVKPFDERELHSTVEMALFKTATDKQVSAQAARLQKIVTAVPDGIALLDANQRIMLENERAQEYLDTLGVEAGSTITQIGDYTFNQLIDGRWHEIRTKQIPKRIFEVKVTAIQPADDQPEAQWVLVLRDVTAEREMRLRVQTHDRLAALGQFAAGMAHDFNNILASILMQPYMIEKTEPQLSDKSRERLANLTKQAQHASNLIKQVLDFSRMSDAVMKPLNVVTLVKEFVKMLERTLPENIRVELRCEAAHSTIQGDPTRLQQMLMNLALNSRDAMPNGGRFDITLQTITTLPDHLEREADAYLRIVVSDSGVGIPPEIIHRVFEPFFTTKGPEQGTGLGLAQVYGIVQQHYGYIDVESHAGQGTTFTIYLPLRGSVNGDEDRYGFYEPLGNATSQQTILLVEDDDDLRQSLAEVLDISGYQVLTAINGRAALDVLANANRAVDLILTDMIMPEMSGVELVRALKEQDYSGKLLVMTGYVSDEIAAELKSLGVADCLSKPIPAAHLLQAIESVF